MGRIQQIINEFADHKAQLKVLEAGCGSISKVEFPRNTHITGIDISENQLRRNTLIDEKILGDIQYYRFKPKSFDIIISWYVLEHVPRPELALKSFAEAIKEGGLVIFAVPNVFSLKGFITKFTPHWFHVFIYKYLHGWKDAGKSDIGPFKAYLRFSIAPLSIKNFARKNGFQIELFSTFDAFNYWVGTSIKEKSKLGYLFIKNLLAFLKTISFGKIGDSEFAVVLKKQEAHTVLQEEESLSIS